MGILNFLKKNNERESTDNKTFWEFHKKTIANAKIEAKEKDEAFFKKFCPMVSGNCRADCVNFVKSYVSDMTGKYIDDDNTIRVYTHSPKCKLWDSKCIR